MGPNHTLANPLSLVHDHPYTRGKIQKFGEEVCRKVPASILLDWSAAEQPLIPNHTVTARETHSQNTSRSAVVESELKLRDEEYKLIKREKTSSSDQRHSKLLAKIKMQAALHENNPLPRARCVCATRMIKEAKSQQRLKQTKRSVATHKGNEIEHHMHSIVDLTGSPPEETSQSENTVSQLLQGSCTPSDLASTKLTSRSPTPLSEWRSCSVDISPTFSTGRQLFTSPTTSSHQESGAHSSDRETGCCKVHSSNRRAGGCKVEAHVASSNPLPETHVRAFSIPLEKVSISH